MHSIAQKCWNSPYFLLTLATLFWGGNAVAAKFLATSMPPLTLSLVRLCLSTILLLPFIYPILQQEWAVARRQYKLLMLLAITGVIGYNLLSYWAAHYTTAVNIALLNSTTPLFMVFLAYFFIREKMTVRLFVSIAISFTGMLWVMTQGSVQRLLALQFNYGDLIMLLAVLLWSIYSIYIKKMADLLSPLAVFGYSSILGVLLMLPASMIELTVTPIRHIGIPELVGIGYVGIFPSICSFLAWNRAVVLVGPSRCSVFSNIIPIWAALLAFLILSEAITSAHFLGGLLVFVGIFLSRLKSKKRDAAPAVSAAGKAGATPHIK